MNIEIDKPPYLLWLDLETTGLSPVFDEILELSYRLTTFDHPWDTIGFGTWTNVDGFRLLEAKASDFVRQMHDESGLAHALLNGVGPRRSIGEMEDTLVAISVGWPEDKHRKVMLAGNSVHFDLGFLREKMPYFARRLSHRVFDVSAMLAFSKSHGMHDPNYPEVHRAAADIERSKRIAFDISEWWDA